MPKPDPGPAGGPGGAARSDPAPDPALVFAALGDPTRLAMVERLAGGERLSISALAADGEISRQAVSKHLAVLERAGLVEAERAGRERRYALRPEPVSAARDRLAHAAARWEAALGRLRAFVEAGERAGGG